MKDTPGADEVFPIARQASSLDDIISIRPDDPVTCRLCGSELERVRINENLYEFRCSNHGVRWTWEYVYDGKIKEQRND